MTFFDVLFGLPTFCQVFLRILYLWAINVFSNANLGCRWNDREIHANRRLVVHLSVKGNKNMYDRIQSQQLLLVRKFTIHWIAVLSIWTYLLSLWVALERLVPLSDPMLSPHTYKSTLLSDIFKSLTLHLTLIMSGMKFMNLFSTALLSKTKTKLNLEKRRTKKVG